MFYDAERLGKSVAVNAVAFVHWILGPMSLVERRRRLPSVNEVDRERGVGDTLEPEVSRKDIAVAGIDFFFQKGGWKGH